jgi:hypothetical protein
MYTLFLLVPDREHNPRCEKLINNFDHDIMEICKPIKLS